MSRVRIRAFPFKVCDVPGRKAGWRLEPVYQRPVVEANPRSPVMSTLADETVNRAGRRAVAERMPARSVRQLACVQSPAGW